METCKHCSNKFINKHTLYQHQTNAKYCLKIQGKINNVFKCTHCKKTFSTQQNLDVHLVRCSKKDIESVRNGYQKEIKDLHTQLSKYEATIKTLQDKLENIAIKAVSRSTTTVNKTQINNIIQKMEPVSSNHLTDQAPNLTIEHVQKGASGYAEYALEYPLKNRIACVDYSRRKIKFKDTEGNIVTDPEMTKLAPMFFESIKSKSSELIHGMNTPDMDSAMFEQVANLFNTNAEVKNSSSGIKSDFYHDFVKHICSGSVVE
jgi:DNA-directed RNA polymerase subunit RPC12/RpoP